MSTEPKASKVGSIPWLAEFHAFWQPALGQGADWWTGQIALLSAAETATQELLSHYRDSLKSAAGAWKQISECNDVFKAAAIQQKWLADTMQGFAAHLAIASAAPMPSMGQGRPANGQAAAPPPTPEPTADKPAGAGKR